MELRAVAKVVQLPEDLLPGEQHSVQLYDYRLQGVLGNRSKVHLTSNAFSFLVEGRKEVMTDAAPIEIRSGQFLMIKSGNCLMVEQVSAERRQYKSILLFFSTEQLLHFVKKYDVLAYAEEAAAPVTVMEYDGYLREFVSSLEHLIEKGNFAGSKLLEVKFEEVMLYLTHKIGTGFLAPFLAELNNQERLFLDVVSNNRLTKLSLTELAFLCNMSLSTFKRTFVRHFQVAPSKWFLEQRLSHARYLLVTKQQRPSDIFDQVGYETLSNFIQAFRKRFGVTPKQLQQERLNF